MELLLVIGGVIALAWGAVVFARGGMLGGSLLVLLAGSCFGFPFFHLPAVPMPLTLDRVLLVVLVVQYALYRYWGWLEHRPWNRTDTLLVSLVGVLFVSTMLHDYQYKNQLPLSQLVFFYGMPAAMYWVARGTKLTERGAMWLCATLAVFGLYLCVTAIAETKQMWWLVWPGYIASTEYIEFFGRGRGPFLNPAATGVIQALGLCAALLAWPRVGRPGKALLLCLSVVFAYGLYCTMTRSTWIGAAVALLVMIALSTPREWRVAALGTMTVCALVMGVVGSQYFLAFKRDKALDASEAAESARLRPILATVAWHMFLDRPILGCGFGQYAVESRDYFSDRTTDLPLEKARPFVQHNVFLGILTETGLVGASLFIALLTSITATAWRLWRAVRAPGWVRQIGLLFLAFMGIYLSNAMFHDLSIIPMMNMFLFFLAGTVRSLAPWLATAPQRADLRLWEPSSEPVLASR